MNFIWTMDETEWKRLKDTQRLKKYDTNDYFGSCYVGGICCDFQHTMDDSFWYAFANLFYVEENSMYGKLKDGTRYDIYYGSPIVPIRCVTFKAFKKKFEKLFEDYINNHEELKSLVKKAVAWKCIS